MTTNDDAVATNSDAMETDNTPTTTNSDRQNNHQPAPPTPREVRLWRLLCEDFNRRYGKSAFNSTLGYNAHPAWELFGNNRHAHHRRQALWQLHKIQLIFWQPSHGWRLRKNWQKKLSFLEKAYLKEEGQLELELEIKNPSSGTPGKCQGENSLSPPIIAAPRPPPN